MGTRAVLTIMRCVENPVPGRDYVILYKPINGFPEYVVEEVSKVLKTLVEAPETRDITSRLVRSDPDWRILSPDEPEPISTPDYCYVLCIANGTACLSYIGLNTGETASPLCFNLQKN